MLDDLPPQKVFDALCEIYSIITSNSQKLPKDSREYLVALAIISSKALTHTREALRILGEHRAIGESIILLRAAYEATVVFLYLIDHEDDFKKYKGFSRLVEHRNQLEMLDIAAEEMTAKGIQEQQVKIQAVKDEIVSNGYNSLFDIHEDDVSNLEKIRNKVDRAHFIGFKSMLKHLEKDKQTKGLVISGFQVYSVGSQVAHSHYHTSISIYAFDNAHPAYDMGAICSQIRDLFIYIAIGLKKLEILREEAYSQKLFPHIIKTIEIMRDYRRY